MSKDASKRRYWWPIAKAYNNTIDILIKGNQKDKSTSRKFMSTD